MEWWLALERQVLLALVSVIVPTMVIGWRRPGVWAGPMAAAALGAIFFIGINGVRLVAPTEYEWVFKLDWRIHFLGWHFFQHEGWQLPPGRIAGFGAPIGTAIGLTDSIPLAAFLLKPLTPWLPTPFQYLGAWLLLCFALQGLFGALIAARWTPNPAVQALAGACFVVMPSLLVREIHPALCAHWLLLWAMWLYLRTDGAAAPPYAEIGALALISGLVHPYLAAMVGALVAAVALRTLVIGGATAPARAVKEAARVLTLTVAAVAAGWWTSGLFTVPGSNLTASGFGEASMNLLSPVTSVGWSRLLPEWWRPASEYWYEGFHYFGAGLLLLVAAAVVWRPLEHAPRIARTVWPIALLSAVLSLYAAGPRVSVGDRVIAELDWLAMASAFRANGRFFWPAAYLVLAASLGTLIVRTPVRVMAPLLAGVLALQVADLRAEYTSRHDARRDLSWYLWAHPLTSPTWHEALPHYDHMVVYQPPQCGAPPTSFENAAYLAGLHRLTINGMLAARADAAAWAEACAALDRTLIAGVVDDRTIYLGTIAQALAFQARISTPLTCGPVDGVGVCVTTASYGAWRDRARLE